MTEATNKAAAEKMNITIIEAALKEIKKIKKPYAELTESDQRSVLVELDFTIRKAIADAVVAIATDKRTAVVAGLDTVTFKDGVKATLKMGKGASVDIHNLADATGQRVLLVLLNDGKYIDGALPSTKKDQGALFDKSRAGGGKKNLRTKRSGGRK